MLDAIPLSLPPAARPKRRGEVAPASTVTLDVPLGPDERALVLVEDEGEYRWIISEEELGPPAAPARPLKRRRGAVAAPPTVVKQARFAISIEAAAAGDATGEARRAETRLDHRQARGQGDRVRFPLRREAYRPAGRQVSSSANVRQGLVAISSADPEGWRLLGDDEPLPAALPADRPARVLLFVHGTFSSTLGSFGALGAIAAGRDFLGACARRL